MAKLTNAEIFEFYDGIQKCKNLNGFDLVMALSANKRILKHLIEDREAILDKPEGYQEYEEKRIKLCELYADKDERDRPKKEFIPTPDGKGLNERFVITKNKEKFDEQIGKLAVEYDDMLDKLENGQIEYNKMRLDPKFYDIEINMINESKLPKNITFEQLDGIRWMLVADVERLFTLKDAKAWLDREAKSEEKKSTKQKSENTKMKKV
jgi:hypothetical protein